MLKFGLTVASLSLVAFSFTACGGDDKATPHSSPAPEVKKEAPAPAHEAKAETPAPATASTPADPAKLFAKCAGCHGQKGEKAALGKSQIIAGWDASKTKDALHGYKNGTYGGQMKSLMKGQVAPLTDADIDALADYISKF
jgi:cytochrome c553